MKKSNKVSVFYVLSSMLLFSLLVFGGCYGIYLSVGLKFVRNSVSNITDGVNTGAQNVSFGGSVDFQRSMIGVIILSIVLIVLAVLDFISIIKQVVLFKQFKLVRESKFEQKIERKVKSKGAVIFFAVLVDLLSLGTGIAGIFVNTKCFSGGNFVWLMYAVDAAVALFSVISFVLLIIKLKQVKKLNSQPDDEDLPKRSFEPVKPCVLSKDDFKIDTTDDINELEDKLLKLRYLKSSKLISPDEYESIRERFFCNADTDKIKKEEN